MRTSILAATMAAVAGVSGRALPAETPEMPNAPLLPPSVFMEAPKMVLPVPFEVAKAIFNNATKEKIEEIKQANSGLLQGLPTTVATTLTTTLNAALTKRATCSNIRTRIEWDQYSNSDRSAFTGAIRCLMGRNPSGQFRQSRSRYEDLVALHQSLTPNVHGNSKFLIWHRYFVWVFEDMLRSECGFNRALPWFDETKYAGRFAQSSVFSSQWFGSVNTGGGCVTNGAFANLALNVGPGQSNQRHCLSRNNDDSRTAQCSTAYVNQCNAFGDHAGMSQCSEGGPHAWGHNGIGGAMSDVFASPSDPVFWLHHLFVDRNYRIWQNQNSARLNSINGNDASGRALTLDTTVSMAGIRPDVRIRDLLDTTATTLCYRYNY